MTPALAQEYIKRRMAELGYGDKYHIRLRHLVLQKTETRIEKAYSSYYVLTEDPADIQIKSQSGVFDLANTNTNELQYEHHGKITFKNNASVPARVRLIQVIPFT